MDDILVGFTVLLEKFLVSNRINIAQKLRSISRNAPEEVAYGNLIDFILYHFSKTSKSCFEELAEKIRYRELLPAVSTELDFRKCDDDEAAYGLLLILVLEYLEKEGYLSSSWRGEFSEVLDSLKNLDEETLALVERKIVELLERAKRITEALVPSQRD